MKFSLINVPLSCFPSDNKLDSMPLKKRISIKKQLKFDAEILTKEWLRFHRIKLSSLSKSNPLLKSQAQTVLTVYLKQGSTLDIHNLSIKHFLDQIVSMGIISDDSVKYVPKSVAEFGGYNKLSSFANFELLEIEK